MEQDSYFDVQDILAGEQLVPCRTLVPLKKMGFLDPKSDGPDIPAGRKLELPLWIAKTLTSGAQRLIEVETPKAFSKTVRESLYAGAKSADLVSLCPTYYQTGHQVIKLAVPGAKDVAESLYQTFRDRCSMLLDCSNQSAVTYGSNVGIMHRLVEPENTLLDMSVRCNKLFEEWKNGNRGNESASSGGSNGRKRTLHI